jgi:hypothetical protein
MIEISYQRSSRSQHRGGWKLAAMSDIDIANAYFIYIIVFAHYSTVEQYVTIRRYLQALQRSNKLPRRRGTKHCWIFFSEQAVRYRLANSKNCVPLKKKHENLPTLRGNNFWSLKPFRALHSDLERGDQALSKSLSNIQNGLMNQKL